MKLTDLNKCGGIGSNCLFIEIGPFRILIDSGLNPKFMGRQALPMFDHLDDNCLDFIIITHCHLDHIGSLPVLLRHQSRAQLLMTAASKILIDTMLHNCANVMMKIKEEHNVPDYPLYTHSEVNRINNLILTVPFNHKQSLHAHNDTLELTMLPSGHIPGAASCQFVYKHRKIFFTGDIQFAHQKILSGANLPENNYDTVVMETTRGEIDRLPENSRLKEVKRLLQTIEHIIQREGAVLIPVFALGRMQEILTIIHEALSHSIIPECPIYCSGLGMEIADSFDEISRKTGQVKFRKKILKEIGVKKPNLQQKPGKNKKRFGIYIVSSGMLIERTPSSIIAADILDDHKNAVCFVGYCALDTPGGKLLNTAAGDEFLFDAYDFVTPVRAQIEKYDLSSHADRNELIDFALATNARTIVLTHGDQDARNWFFDNLTDLACNIKIVDPVPLNMCLV